MPATVLWICAALILGLAIIGVAGSFIFRGSNTKHTVTQKMSSAGNTHVAVEGLARLIERFAGAQYLTSDEADRFRSQLDLARVQFDSKLSDTNRWVQDVQRKMLDHSRHHVRKAGFSYGFFTLPYQKRLWFLLVVFALTSFLNAFSSVSAVSLIALLLCV